VTVESVEFILDIVATRQIDTRAKALEYTDFNAMRDRYLEQRTARCAALVALMRQ
jgi:phospholipid-binding lipoprotein MlaA